MSDVYTFFSYARIDNSATHDRLRMLSEDIATQYMSMSGLKADVFFDSESISLGERWRQRIESGLVASTFLFAIISPAYMRSLWCRDELRTYLTLVGGGQSRMIVPLLLYPMEEIDRRFPGDELWNEIKELKFRSIHSLRAEERGSREWMFTVIEIASKMDEIVGPLNMSASNPESNGVGQVLLLGKSTPSGELASPAGILELQAAAENALPRLTEVAARFSHFVNQVGDEMTAATPRARQATSFKDKLAAANSLASKLEPIAEAALGASNEMRQIVADVSPGISAILGQVANSPTERADPGMQEFISNVKGMIEGIAASYESSIVFRDSMEGNKGFSRSLDRVLITLQDSLLAMVDLNAMAQAWGGIIESFEED
ncbi:toll/interleukin-1 receptor domain-containing protein [Actinosynnema sp. NPDC020468]|uniref:toll/interleukin-1 receptor domain-containing protein n=1 Tax=Actinosynnema sp. NPDC020468 TaxID=3154488 RepID=UPI0033E9C3C3